MGLLMVKCKKLVKNHSKSSSVKVEKEFVKKKTSSPKKKKKKKICQQMVVSATSEGLERKPLL